MKLHLINYLNKIITIVSFCYLLSLTGCVFSPSQQDLMLTKIFSTKNLNTFLGKSPQALVKEFGNPVQKTVKGHQTELVFSKIIKLTVPVQTGYATYQGWSPNAYGPGKGGYIGGSYGQNQYNMYSYQTISETCYVTFILVDNAVVHWNRQGNAQWCGNQKGYGINEFGGLI